MQVTWSVRNHKSQEIISAIQNLIQLCDSIYIHELLLEGVFLSLNF